MGEYWTVSATKDGGVGLGWSLLINNNRFLRIEEVSSWRHQGN